jgi:hypothetical protein
MRREIAFMSSPTPAARPFLLALCAALAATGGAKAARRIYSYDSANPAAERMTEAGLTFVLEKSLLSVRVLKLVETHDVGAADLKPASEGELGRGGLSGLLGRAPERDLYEITDQEDGLPLKRALCHADRVWLVFGRIKSGEDLRVHAVTYDPKTGKGRLCVTLDYAFHGEWALPVAPMKQPDRSDPFNDTPNNTLAGPAVGPTNLPQ